MCNPGNDATFQAREGASVLRCYKSGPGTVYPRLSSTHYLSITKQNAKTGVSFGAFFDLAGLGLCDDGAECGAPKKNKEYYGVCERLGLPIVIVRELNDSCLRGWILENIYLRTLFCCTR